MSQKSQQSEILIERVKDACKFQDPFDKTFAKNQLSLPRCLDAIEYFTITFSAFFFLYFHCYYFYYNFYFYPCYYYHYYYYYYYYYFYITVSIVTLSLLLLLYYHHNSHYCYHQVYLVFKLFSMSV